MERHRIGIVIPALNEAATIGGVVSNVSQYGVPIVVDDGSTNETGNLAIAAGARVVRQEVNRGYDQALNSGFTRASKLGCECVVTDVVVGSRDHRQRIAEHIFAWLGP